MPTTKLAISAQPPPVALDVARQQQHVRQHEVQGDQRPADPLPAVLRAHPVVRDFFLRVGRVDDDELRERQVGPQHDEGEEQLAQIVQVRRVDHPVEWRLLGEHHQHGDGEGQRRQPLADDVEQAPHRREPVGVDRHRPVDDGEGHGQPEHQQPAAGELAHLADERRVAGAILLGRPGAEAHRQERPHREVEDVADDEERHVEVGHLVADHRVGRGHVGVRPVVEVAHAGENRQAEHRHHRQRAGGRLEDAADDHAPGAAAQVLHHQQREAAECHARPVHPGDEVGLVEAIEAAHRDADHGEHAADRRGDHRLALEAREALGRVVGVRRHVVPGPGPSARPSEPEPRAPPARRGGPGRPPARRRSSRTG